MNATATNIPIRLDEAINRFLQGLPAWPDYAEKLPDKKKKRPFRWSDKK